MIKLPFTPPAPDYPAFERMLTGQELPRRVHVGELRMDPELVQWVTENVFGERWVTPEQGPAAYWPQFIRFCERLGYDFFCPWGFPWVGLPTMKERRGADTAALSSGQRAWVEEEAGVIADWDDFHRFPWDAIQYDLSTLDALEAALPAGMRLAVSTHWFAMVYQKLLGMERLSLMTRDNPALIAAVLDRWGEKVYAYYEACLQRDSVVAVMHSDDLGHKTATLLSPDWLREYVLPWLGRFAALAHGYGKQFWLHSCGNTLAIMEDLIEDVRIDAYHSFQDVILPVAEFHRRYGNRIGVIGGVDMDALGRMPLDEFHPYVRSILDQCQPRGRYALGAGNSLANYVRPENYLAMLEEAWNWTAPPPP
jgi:uroporphyrinogen decarboxylase